MFEFKDRVSASRRLHSLPSPWLSGLLALTLSLSMQCAYCDDAQQAYVFGVFPFLPPVQIEEVFGPVAREFSQVLDAPVQLRTGADLESFERALRAQEYDIAYVNPFLYVEAHDQHGYLPLVRNRETLFGLVVTLRDREVAGMAGLRGQVLALPPPAAAVSKLTLLLLREHGLRPALDVQLLYHDNHRSCLHSVLIRRAAACVTAAVPLRQFRVLAERVRVLARTAPMPASVFVAHRRLGAARYEALRARALSWPSSESGRRVLEDLAIDTLGPARDSDYDIVRIYIERVGSL